MARELGALSTSPAATEITAVLTAGELVELSERVYRSVFRAGLWVALTTAGYALGLAFVQVEPIDRGLAAGICIVVAAGLARAARDHVLVYDRLHRRPALALLPALALAAGHVAIGSGSQLLFPPSLVVLGVLSAAISMRWVFFASMLVGAAQASVVFIHGHPASDAYALLTAAAADVFAPLLFAALLDRLARFMLDLQRALATRSNTPAPPIRVRAWVHRPARTDVKHGRPDQRQLATECWPRVTARQHQVILLVAAGESYATVAACLGISEGRVTKLLAEARQRVGVTTTQQLVAWAIDAGMVWRHPEGDVPPMPAGG